MALDGLKIKVLKYLEHTPDIVNTKNEVYVEKENADNKKANKTYFKFHFEQILLALIVIGVIIVILESDIEFHKKYFVYLQLM